MTPPILLFDGECGLCHFLVLFLAKRTTKEQLLFAPLGGTTALKWGFGKSAETAVLILDPEILLEGRAALKAVSLAGGLYQVAALLARLPSWLVNPPYRWVASRRGSFMGKECNVDVLRETIASRLLS